MVLRVLPLNTALFLVILLEGYVVLASELLAIRLLVPHVGSGVEVVSIVISGVLLPLAYGYYYGGKRYHTLQPHKKNRSIRSWLLKNLASAMAILTLGLSFIFLELFFATLSALGVKHFIAQTAIYTAIFIVYPVFLLAQTVPLISNYFKQTQLSRITGRMLFFSTIGSFLGSVVSTIILMNLIGAHLTAAVTICLLAVAIFILCRRGLRFDHLYAVFVALLALALNSPSLQQTLGIVGDSAYNTATVVDMPEKESRGLYLNNSRSSLFSANPAKRFPYVQYIEQHILNTMPADGNVLVLGAGGFTIGFDDRRRRYVFVDIDPTLKEISEAHLLPEKIPANKEFVAQSVRQFLNQSTEAFDVIIAEVYTNKQSIPTEATTLEFWQAVQAKLKPNGIVVANLIISPRFDDLFSSRIARTFSTVFPNHLRQAVDPVDFWQTADPKNILFIHKSTPHDDDQLIYTDDLNPHSLDHYRQ